MYTVKIAFVSANIKNPQFFAKISQVKFITCLRTLFRTNTRKISDNSVSYFKHHKGSCFIQIKNPRVEYSLFWFDAEYCPEIGDSTDGYNW